jgi:hypothetical protein
MSKRVIQGFDSSSFQLKEIGVLIALVEYIPANQKQFHVFDFLPFLI